MLSWTWVKSPLSVWATVADPTVAWLLAAAQRYMSEHDLETVTPDVIAHVIEVGGEENRIAVGAAMPILLGMTQ